MLDDDDERHMRRHRALEVPQGLPDLPPKGRMPADPARLPMPSITWAFGKGIRGYIGILSIGDEEAAKHLTFFRAA